MGRGYDLLAPTPPHANGKARNGQEHEPAGQTLSFAEPRERATGGSIRLSLAAIAGTATRGADVDLDIQGRLDCVYAALKPATVVDVLTVAEDSTLTGSLAIRLATARAIDVAVCLTSRLAIDAR